MRAARGVRDVPVQLRVDFGARSAHLCPAALGDPPHRPRPDTKYARAPARAYPPRGDRDLQPPLCSMPHQTRAHTQADWRRQISRHTLSNTHRPHWVQTTPNRMQLHMKLSSAANTEHTARSRRSAHAHPPAISTPTAFAAAHAHTPRASPLRAQRAARAAARPRPRSARTPPQTGPPPPKAPDTAHARAQITHDIAYTNSHTGPGPQRRLQQAASHARHHSAGAPPQP